MDLHWPYVKAAFPPNRRFILSRRDDFEDAKSRAWTGLGERVERIEGLDGPSFSATDFRNALADDRPIDEFLSVFTLRELDRLGIRDGFCARIRQAVANG